MPNEPIIFGDPFSVIHFYDPAAAFVMAMTHPLSSLRRDQGTVNLG